MTIRGSRRPHIVPISAPSFPTSPRSYVYRKIAYTFIALVAIVVLSILWLSSVRAEILVKAKRDTVKLDGIVEIARTPQPGQIPGRVVQSVFEKVQEFQVTDVSNQAASSSTETPTTTASVPPPVVTPPASSVTPSTNVIARGTVRIVNKYSRPQTLVKTTRLLTADQKLYRIERTIRIESGKEVSVNVYADQPGQEFVIGPTNFTIPGLFVDLQKYIYAVSDAAFTAAPSDQPLPVKAPTPKVSENKKETAKPLAGTKSIVTAANITEAQRILTEAILDQAKKKLAADINDPRFGEVVIFFKTLDKKTNATVGQVSDSFLASVKLDVTAVYFPKEDMTALIRTRLKERIPEGREFLPLEDGAVVYTLESADAKNEVASLRVVADGAYRLTTSSPGLDKGTIAGKTVSEAIEVLRSVPGVDEVKINIKPGWLGKVPALKDHIEVKIE